MRRSRKNARRATLRSRADGVDPPFRIRTFERGEEFGRVADPQKHVRFRERGKEFADKLFGQTARNDDLFEFPAAVTVSFQNGLDRLFARGV